MGQIVGHLLGSGHQVGDRRPPDAGPRLRVGRPEIAHNRGHAAEVTRGPGPLASAVGGAPVGDNWPVTEKPGARSRSGPGLRHRPRTSNCAPSRTGSGALPVGHRLDRTRLRRGAGPRRQHRGQGLPRAGGRRGDRDPGGRDGTFVAAAGGAAEQKAARPPAVRRARRAARPQARPWPWPRTRCGRRQGTEAAARLVRPADPVPPADPVRPTDPVPPTDKAPRRPRVLLRHRRGAVPRRGAYSSASELPPPGSALLRPQPGHDSLRVGGPTCDPGQAAPRPETAGCSQAWLVVTPTSTFRPWPSDPSVRFSGRDSAWPAVCLASPGSARRQSAEQQPPAGPSPCRRPRRSRCHPD
ncbi:hypothetical protein SCYAM73S_00324 [Streptomyces cyaneofuscatus]